MASAQTSAAPSQPAPVTWAVKVAEGSRCGEDGTFEDALAAQIPFTQRAPADGAELVATVSVGRDGEGARIVVFDRVLQAEAGARELPLSSRRCEKIAEAVSLVFAVLIEAGRGALVIAPEPTPAVPEEPPKPEAKPDEKPKEKPEAKPAVQPVPPLVPRRANRPPPRARPVWRGPPSGHDLSAAAGSGYGLLPGFGLGVTGGWGIRPPGTWPIWLHATGWLESASADRRGRFRALYGGVMTCPLRGERGRVRGRVCPSLAVGGLWARGSGFDDPVTSRRPLVLAGVELAGSVTLVGPLELTLIGRVEGVPMRSKFVYRTRSGAAPEIHTPSPVVGSLFGGLALRFR